VSVLESSSPPERGFRWDRLTVTLGLGYALLALALGINVVLASLRADLGLSATVTSLHGSFFGWGLLLVGSAGGRVVGSLGRRRTYLSAAVLTGVGSALFATGANVAVTLLGALAVGLGGAMMMIVVPGVVADLHGAGRSAAFTAINAIPAAVGLTSPLLIGAAITLGVGWNLAYGIPAVAAAWLVATRARADAWPADASTSASPWQLLRRKRFRSVWLLLVCGIVVEFGIVVWGVTFLREVAGASEGVAPMLGVGFAIGIGIGRALTPAVLRRHHETSLVRAGFAVAATGGFLLLVPSLPVRVLAFAIVGLGAGPVYPLLVDRLFSVVGSDEPGVGVAAALASGTAITFGPLAIGVLADVVGLRIGIAVIPVLAVVGLVATGRVLHDHRIATSVASS
jgi:MFS family permease